jgi:Flp pilus assembly protein TadG
LGENPVSASLDRRASGAQARGPAGLFAKACCERGQGVVEFAMVLPFLAAFVFVLFSFGKTLYYYIELTHVANEGARIAAVSQASLPINPTTNAPYTSLAAYLCSQMGKTGGTSELRTGSGDTDAATVTVSYDNGGSTGSGDPVTISVQTHYYWISNAFRRWFPIPRLGIDIVGSSTMRIENPVSATDTKVITGGTCTN